jgi:uncharacterized repeat protein (TIGR03803 family)
MRGRLALTVVLAGGLLLPPVAFPQPTFELIHRFEGGAANPLGRLIEAPDGALYGTTYHGGHFDGGTVFALRPAQGGTWSHEAVHSFRPTLEGGNPFGSLILGRDGSFYGLTTVSGPVPRYSTGAGTVFRMTPSGEVSVLHTFLSTDGGMPVWRLLEASDGNLYGGTCHACESTIFRITPSGSFTPLHVFACYSYPFALLDGLCPVTELKEGAGGLLYGQATLGGPYGYSVPENGAGTLFSIDPLAPPSQNFTLLHAFRGPEGAQPVGGFIEGPGGALLGSTYKGGPFGFGSIIRLEASGAVTTVHAFQGDDGAYPYGSLLKEPDGTIYGAATEGGAGFGTLFQIDPQGQFAVLHSFTGQDGRQPVELMRSRDGHFFGVTYRGGPGGGGTAYRMGPDHTIETLHAFSAGPSGAVSGVIEASDGNLYGTTWASGFGGGTVFKLSPDRRLTIVHDFEPNGNDETYPSNVTQKPSRLIEATDGFLYGTTFAGGVRRRGSVFRVGKTGGLTVLHSFVDDSQCRPEHGVIQASDGNFYGTTADLFEGSVFRVDASGVLTTLHSFDGPDGRTPSGPLVEGADGGLYGATRGGGAFGKGTIFKVTTGGEFTLVHSFDGSVGELPVGGLIWGVDGHLYGVTRQRGTLFRWEAGGGVATVHAFTTSEGEPLSLIQGRDGALYGVTLPGWLGSPGTDRIFRYTPSGVTFLYTTVDADGRGASPLTQGTDGALYGTMEFGPQVPSSDYKGGVFRLTLSP